MFNNQQGDKQVERASDIGCSSPYKDFCRHRSRTKNKTTF